MAVANWQQEERRSTGTSRALSAPLSRRGMGEALEGGCGLASSAGLTKPGAPPALTPSAGFAELRVFGFHLFGCRGGGAKMLREGASLPATQPGTARHGTGAAGSPGSSERQATVPRGQAATRHVTRATVTAWPRVPWGTDVQLHRRGEEACLNSGAHPAQPSFFGTWRMQDPQE